MEIISKFYLFLSITTQDLANGISKAAASAKAAGVTIDELVGAVAAIGTTTRESGDIIGNSLKTIYARISTMPKAEETFKAAGVAYRDISGNLKPAGELIKELAANWNNLSSEQQLNTAKTLAGLHQYNRFIAYMQNFAIAQDATTTSINSQGSAMRENAKYMDSLGARVARMKTAWETLSIAFGDAVISNSVIALTAGIAGLLNFITPLVQHIGALPIVFGALSTAIFIGSAAFQAFIINTAKAVAAVFGIIPAATGAAGAIGATGAAAAGASVGVKALTFSLRGLMITTGVGLGFALLGIVIEKVIGLFGKASDAADSFSSSQEKLEQSANELSSIKTLGESYKELYGKVGKTVEEKAKLATIESQLSSQFGISTTHLNGQAKSYQEIQQEIQKTIDLKEEEWRLEQLKTQKEYEEKSGDAVKEAEKLKKKYDESRKAYEDALKTKEEYDAKVKSGAALGEMLGSSTVRYSMSNDEAALAVQQQAKSYSTAVNDALEEMNTANTEMEIQIGKRAKAFRAIFSNQVDVFKKNGKEVNDSMLQFFDAYATAAAQSNMSDLDFTTSIPDVFEKLNSMGPKTVTQFGQTIQTAGASVQEFVAEINKLSGVTMTEEAIRSLNQALARTGFLLDSANTDPYATGMEDVRAAVGEAALSMETLGDVFGEVSNYIKSLNKLIYDSIQGHKLTSEEVADLIIKYPELANSIKETADGWEIEVKAVEQLRDLKRDAFKKSIEDAKANSLATVNGALKNVEAMGVEVKQVKDLTEAKAQLALITEELNGINEQEKKNKEISDMFKFPTGMNELGGFGDLPADLKKTIDADKAAKEQRKAKLQEYLNGISEAVSKNKELQKVLDGLLGTIEDNTYGTNAQADAQKEAGDAAKEAEKTQKDLNDQYSDTIEILTDLQKAMKKVENQMDKENRKRERMNKNSKEYRDSLERENKLLEKHQTLLKQGMADPSQLISTTMTTSYDGGGTGGNSTVQSPGLNSLFAKAAELASNDAFDYKQVSGKFQGTFEEFLKRGIADCSQYVQEMYDEFLKIRLPRTVTEQAKLGKTITNKKELEPGDLVFFNTTGKADSHVGIYVGDGKFTQMGTKGLTYQSDLNSDYWSSRYTHGQRIEGVNTKAGSGGINNVTYNVDIKNAYAGQYAKDINNSAEKHGVNPQLIAAIIKAESNFNPNAKSSAGAQGLMQLMPKTAQGLGVKNAYDPTQNIEGGTSFFAQMLTKYKDPTIALYAYNWGPGNIDKWIKSGSVFANLPKETQAYANKVLGNFKANGGNVSGTGTGEGGYKTSFSSATTQDLINAAEQATDDYNNDASKHFKNNLEIIDSTIGELEDQFDHIGRLIQNSSRTQSNYVESSKQWRKEEQAQIDYRLQQIATIKKENTQGAKLLDQKKINRNLYDKQFAENIQRVKDLEQQNIESRTAIFNSQIQGMEAEAEAVNRELGKSQALADQMDTSSETYRKELQRQIKLKKRIVTENKNLIASAKERLKTERLTLVEREQLNKLISDKSLENFNLNLDVKDDIGTFTDSRVDAYTQKQGQLANALNLSKSKMSLLEEGSKEWRQEINNQIGIVQKQIDVHKIYVAELKTMIKRTDLTAEQTAKLTQALAEANIETYNLEGSLKELYQQRFNVDTIIEDFKKMLDKQKDLELKNFDERKKAEEERHEKAMKNAQDEYDLFEKTIQAQLKAIDRQSDEDSYQDELNKKLEERQKLQVLINNLSRDDSFEARARREQLQEDLNQKDEDITKFRLDRETEIRKQNLNDQLEDKKKTLDDSQKVENKSNEDTLKGIENEKEVREQYYADLMENEKYWYDLKKNLMSEDKNTVLETLDTMQARYGEFFSFLEAHANLLSTQGLENVEYTYKDDQKNLTDYANTTKKPAEYSQGSPVQKDWEQYLSNKQKAEAILKLMKDSAAQNKTGTPTKYYNDLLKQFNTLKAANDIIRARNQSFPDYSYDQLKNMKPFSAETGGMTPAGIGKKGKFLLAHEKELILNKTDTSLMLKAVYAARDYAQQNAGGGFLSSFMNKVLPRLENNQRDTTTGNGDLIIQIENVYTEDQDSLNKFYGDIRNELKKKGK